MASSKSFIVRHSCVINLLLSSHVNQFFDTCGCMFLFNPYLLFKHYQDNKMCLPPFEWTDSDMNVHSITPKNDGLHESTHAKNELWKYQSGEALLSVMAFIMCSSAHNSNKKKGFYSSLWYFNWSCNRGWNLIQRIRQRECLALKECSFKTWSALPANA